MIFLQTTPGSGWSTYALFGAMFLVFYFFMIRPQNKKRKKLEEMRNNLKKGDNIQTIGGIHGKVAEVKDTTVTIQVEGGVKLKIEKSFSRTLINELSNLGHDIQVVEDGIGGGQGIIINRKDGILIGGSDSRKDGLAIGY